METINQQPSLPSHIKRPSAAKRLHWERVNLQRRLGQVVRSHSVNHQMEVSTATGWNVLLLLFTSLFQDRFQLQARNTLENLKCSAIIVFIDQFFSERLKFVRCPDNFVGTYL